MRRRAPLAIDLPCPLHECLHQCSRDVIEYRPDQLLEDTTRILITHAELDFAATSGEVREAPPAVEASKRTLDETDAHFYRCPLFIFGGKALAKAVIVDEDRRASHLGVSIKQSGATTPRQESRIVLDTIHQREHLVGAILNQHGTTDFRHGLRARCNDRRAAPGPPLL